MSHSAIPVLGLGGDALSAPENTESAYWAALGGGAEGLVIAVRLSADGIVICSNYDDFGPTCGDNRQVSALDWDEIRRLDAGFTYRSTVLDDMNQPTGQRGDDTPWIGNLPSKRAIDVARLSDVLGLFARRCLIVMVVPDGQPDLLAAVLTDLAQNGVAGRMLLAGSADICAAARAQSPACRTMLVGGASAPAAQLDAAADAGAEALYLDWTVACPVVSGQMQIDPDLAAALGTSEVAVYLGSDDMPFAATPAHFAAIRAVAGIGGIIARGVLPSVEMVTPPAVIVQDDFPGTHINRAIWTAGYSHTNSDTTIHQDDGLHISMIQGGSYSGAAAVTVRPTHGRFDAQVGFHVENPANATTFELAAICIDPGYFNIDSSDPDAMRVNLTFDVHGAPPYASSERDEDDGFRSGWNNGFNLTRIEDDWNASSANMYNKYGRDVGDGTAGNPDGHLRLIRNGAVFVSYYRDKHNAAWVCSGVMLVQNMSQDVFLRLAGKHWAKGDTPPANHIIFRDFQLRQF